MRCLNCGEKVAGKKIGIPRKCKNCGTNFNMRLNKGCLLYSLTSFICVIFILYIVKKICSNDSILYVVSAFEIVIIPNVIEKIMAYKGLIKYDNLEIKQTTFRTKRGRPNHQLWL